MSGPLWGQLLLLERLRGKVLCGEAHADALGQEAEGSQGHVLLTWIKQDSACSPFPLLPSPHLLQPPPLSPGILAWTTLAMPLPSPLPRGLYRPAQAS